VDPPKWKRTLKLGKTSYADWAKLDAYIGKAIMEATNEIMERGRLKEKPTTR
jgi:hypothetical protein